MHSHKLYFSSAMYLTNTTTYEMILSTEAMRSLQQWFIYWLVVVYIWV